MRSSRGAARWGTHVRVRYPGLLAATTVALAAMWLSQQYNAPVMLFALLLGIALSFLNDQDICKVGIDFASRSVLRVGVALLGLRISAHTIVDLGTIPIVTVLTAVVTTILFGVVVSRILKLGHEFGILSGGAVAICGASAALAISAALGDRPNKGIEVVLCIVGVTTLSTLAMIVYPPFGAFLQLSPPDLGLFIGGTIHDVAQVVGAGYMISPEVGDIATYVKLLRVSLLVPVVLLVATLIGRTANHSERAALFPTFLVMFCVLVAMNSAFTLPRFITDGSSTISASCLVVAIAALGMKTRFGDFINLGWTPVVVIVGETIWIACMVLFMIVLKTSGYT